MKKIKELEEIDKPREKLSKKGAKALKNYELVAAILGSGVRNRDVLSLSKDIIKLFDNDFENVTLEKLTSIYGLGEAKAISLLCAIELSKRYLIKQNKQINSAKDIFELLDEFKNKKQEYFISFTLDGANHLINKRVVFIGTLNYTLVHPREVFADALIDRAASIIVAHNHPSNLLTPSAQDIEITKRLKKAGELLGIELLDHIVFAKDGFLSLKEEGYFYEL